MRPKLDTVLLFLLRRGTSGQVRHFLCVESSHSSSRTSPRRSTPVQVLAAHGAVHTAEMQ